MNDFSTTVILTGTGIPHPSPGGPEPGHLCVTAASRSSLTPDVERWSA